MKSAIRKVALSTISIAMTIAATTLPAQAARNAEILPEVESCVAELTSRLDVREATKVRHVVTDYKKSALGYAVKLQTSVFTPDAETKYYAYCVAKGSKTPIKFRWKALDV